MANDLKITLGDHYDAYIRVPITLLERLQKLSLLVQKAPEADKEEYMMAFDEDGLLSIRCVSRKERWRPVLTSHTSLWIRRFKEGRLTEVREVELDSLGEQDT